MTCQTLERLKLQLHSQVLKGCGIEKQIKTRRLKQIALYPGFVFRPGMKTQIPRRPDISVNFDKCSTYVTGGRLLSGCNKGINNMVLKPVFTEYTAGHHNDLF